MVSYKRKPTFPMQFNNHAPSYLPKGAENICPCKTYIWMFIAALFIIAKTWKQPTHPAGGEWINKLVHSHNGLLFSVKKK